MRVTLASGLEDLYVDSDGTAVVMIDNAVLALSKLSTIVLQVLSAHGADGVESGDLWEIVRHAVGDPPGDGGRRCPAAASDSRSSPVGGRAVKPRSRCMRAYA